MLFPVDLAWVAFYSLLEAARESGYEPSQVLPVIVQSLAARADFEKSMAYLNWTLAQ